MTPESYLDTLPETNISPENRPLESRTFLLETIIFRGENVSFSELLFLFVSFGSFVVYLHLLPREISRYYQGIAWKIQKSKHLGSKNTKPLRSWQVEV